MRGSAFVRFPLAAFVMKSWGSDRDEAVSHLYENQANKTNAAKVKREKVSLPISILQKLLPPMPQKIKMPKAAPLISISRRRFISNAKKVEHKFSQAPDFYKGFL